MFDRMYVRRYIAIAWILAYIILIILFDTLLFPKNEVMGILNNLENSVAAGNWNRATVEMEAFKTEWEKGRFRISINNASEEHAVLEQSIGDLESQIKYREDDALESIGGIKKIIANLNKSFPKP